MKDLMVKKTFEIPPKNSILFAEKRKQCRSASAVQYVRIKSFVVKPLQIIVKL